MPGTVYLVFEAHARQIEELNHPQSSNRRMNELPIDRPCVVEYHSDLSHVPPDVSPFRRELSAWYGTLRMTLKQA
jgi:hypothetical protein